MVKFNILEILTAIAILFIRISADYLNASEHFNKAIELNATDKVHINKQISNEISEIEGEILSATSRQNNKLSRDIPNVSNMNAKCIKNMRNSMFVSTMIFA